MPRTVFTAPHRSGRSRFGAPIGPSQWMWIVLCLAALGCSGCESVWDEDEEPPKAVTPPPPPAALAALPATWDQGSTRAFEALFAAWQARPALTWDETSRAQLLQILSAPIQSVGASERAVRAALMLSLDQGPNTPALLTVRLERRFVPDARGHCASEIVCARALGQRQPLQAPWPDHLRVFAVGPYPHPDLDVRVECARAFLEPYDPERRPVPLSTKAVLQFLVRVLRAETPDQRMDPPDWKRVETLAWTKNRAADTLRRWWPDAPPYSPDGAWEAQNEWARAIATRLNLED